MAEVVLSRLIEIIENLIGYVQNVRLSITIFNNRLLTTSKYILMIIVLCQTCIHVIAPGFPGNSRD